MFNNEGNEYWVMYKFYKHNNNNMYLHELEEINNLLSPWTSVGGVEGGGQGIEWGMSS